MTSSISLKPKATATDSPAIGTRTRRAITAAVSWTRLFRIELKVTDPPRMTNAKGVAMLAISPKNFSMMEGSLTPKMTSTKAETAPMMIGLPMIPLRTFLRLGLEPLKYSKAMTERVLISGTTTPTRIEATPRLFSP
ncbi:hypothetical protein SDC9_172194 [bioreactor metagenome]|uniref:Uncharacterized protein n=1 Tax=bioreactor metagenome TaxID=1076179 RepID=A0A645GFI2_9ZZZZ